MIPAGLRFARLLVTAVVIAAAGWILIDAFRDWSLSDMDAYWNAAMRLRGDEPLYAASYSSGAHDLYRYAPWFAFAWVPLTFLPRTLVSLAWEMLLAAATVAAVSPTLMRRTLPATLLGVLLGALLVWTVAKANVHPLMIAGLVWGVRRRSGPLWIALATSIKAAPLAFIVVYAGRREWGRVMLTLFLTALLVVPMLFYDLSGYATEPGVSGSLWSLFGPEAWVALALGTAAIGLRLAAGRFAWLAGSTAVLAAFPRLLDYDVSLLLVASGSPGGTPPPLILADVSPAGAPTNS